MKNSQKGFVIPLLIILAVIIIIGGAYYFYNKPHSVQMAEVVNETVTTNSSLSSSSNSPLPNLSDAINTYFPESKNPNVYVTPIPYVTSQTTATKTQTIGVMPKITFQSSWGDITSSKIAGENYIFNFSTGKYIIFDDYSLKNRYSPSNYPWSNIDKSNTQWLSQNKEMFDSSKIVTSSDFIKYILGVTPTTILKETNADIAQADYRLLLIKGSLFANTGKINKIFQFSNKYVNGYVLDPISPADNVVVIAVTSSGDIYDVIIHNKSQYSKTDIDTLVSSLKIE